ncbi:hypothetical protein B0H16DRAFT_1719287 [Mycena metata]|uniref:Uncharacterized protein n=1 Tax=Mycena metata TaxID=1033252 RepID=A0AAD7JGS8_9AGAR|nr:hypothetical protein B0H16DRAFT_1719287 [Mycena metata]
MTYLVLEGYKSGPVSGIRVWGVGEEPEALRWDRPSGGSGMRRGEGGALRAPPPLRVYESIPRPEQEQALSAWLDERKGSGEARFARKPNSTTPSAAHNELGKRAGGAATRSTHTKRSEDGEGGGTRTETMYV